MKLKLLSIAVFLFLVQFVNAQQASFEKYIVKNKDWKETSKTKWEVYLKAKKGSLCYIGAEHLDQPHHPQFKKIEKEWLKFGPSIALYEGPDRGIAESDSITISKFGESGYVRYLAKQKGIPTKSLEPNTADLYQYLTSKKDQLLVDLYMLSKEAMRLRTRKGLKKAELEKELTTMLGMVDKMLGRRISIQSLQQLEVEFEKQFGKTYAWWEAPADWFDPQSDSNRVTNQLATLSTEYRDIYMVKLISDLVNQGEKVFAVVGRNHVPLQEQAIRYAVGLQ